MTEQIENIRACRTKQLLHIYSIHIWLYDICIGIGLVNLIPGANNCEYAETPNPIHGWIDKKRIERQLLGTSGFGLASGSWPKCWTTASIKGTDIDRFGLETNWVEKQNACKCHLCFHVFLEFLPLWWGQNSNTISSISSISLELHV